jgi:hypothetical protein
MLDYALPLTRLIAVRKSLASCVRAIVTRSTVEAPLTEAADRLNRFPATPLCSITWFIEGEVEMVEPPPPDPLPAFERAIFVGPQTAPTITYNPGPVRTFVVIFYPQAIHALCGIEVPDWMDRWMPVGDALGPEWAAMAQAVLAAPDDGVRLAIIERFLEPRWQAVRPSDAIADAGDWVRHLAVQAAGTGFGRSVRILNGASRRGRASRCALCAACSAPSNHSSMPAMGIWDASCRCRTSLRARVMPTRPICAARRVK